MLDDRLWRDVWERNLDPVERHTIAMAVWRRRHPAGRFETIVAFELARRWRRHIRSLAVVYGLWTVFWGMIAIRDLRLDAAFESLVTPVCAVLGLVAIGACVVIRRRLAGYLRANAAPLR
jgi:hypothetical protein